MNRIFNIGLLLLGACFLNGCLNAPFVDHLAGTPLSTTDLPYFHHKNLFINNEDDVHLGFDLSRYPTKNGADCDVYVVEHKHPSQWRVDPSLVDVTGGHHTMTNIGGNMQQNSNRPLLWSPNIPDVDNYPYFKDYDIVMDFGQDAEYDTLHDIIDYIGEFELGNAVFPSGGFTVIKDPAEQGNFDVEDYRYDEGNWQIWGSCECPSDSTITHNISMLGRIYYPEDPISSGKISNQLDKYPLVLIAHGLRGNNIFSYQGFAYLINLLVSRGYICVSVALHDLDATSPPQIYERGLAIIEHLDYLLRDAGTTDAFILNQLRPKVDYERIALLGHSRGGEGIIAAQDIYQGITPPPSYHIEALCSLAPTDVTQDPSGNDVLLSPCGPYTPKLPYLMIAATRDTDLVFNPGNRILDRAARPKYGINIYGGNHNNFNMLWPPDEYPQPYPSPPDPLDWPMLSASEQQNITKSYVHSFMNIYLKDQQAYLPLFNDYTPPRSQRIVDAPLILHSYQPKGWANTRLTIDHFDDLASNININSLSNPNSNGAGLTPDEEWMVYATGSPVYFTTYSNGGRMEWKSSDYFRFEIKGKKILHYGYLNFRVAQRFDITSNQNAPYVPQNIEVYLTDANGNTSNRIDASTYCTYEIPYNDNHPGSLHPKTIMQTVTIPIRAFTANGAHLDLDNPDELTFEFEPRGTGDLLIDDVEFLGLDISEPDPKPVTSFGQLLRLIFIKNWPKKAVIYGN